MVTDIQAEADKFVASAKSLAVTATQITSFGDFVSFIFAATDELVSHLESVPPLDARDDGNLRIFSTFDSAASEVVNALAVSTPWQVAGFGDRSTWKKSTRGVKRTLRSIVELADDLDRTNQILLAGRLYRYFDTLLGLRVVALARRFSSYYAHLLANVVETAAFQEPSCLSLLTADEVETLASTAETKFTPQVNPFLAPTSGFALFHIDMFAAIRNAQFQAVTALVRSLKTNDTGIARSADTALERLEHFFTSRELLPTPSFMFDFDVRFNLYSLMSHIERLRPQSARRSGHAYLLEVPEAKVAILVGFPDVCDYIAEPTPENRRNYEANPFRFTYDHVKNSQIVCARRVAEARRVLQTVEADAAMVAEWRTFLRVTVEGTKVVADVATDGAVIGAATYAVLRLLDSQDPVRDAALAAAIAEFIKEISRRVRHRCRE